jgi:hypothetical protein
MDLQLRWLSEPRVTCFYAADAARRGLTLVNAAASRAFAEPVGEFQEPLKTAGVDADRFWEAIVSLAALGIDNRLLVEKSLAVAGNAPASAATVERLAPCVAALEQAAHSVWPRLEEELRWRERPLREQWESRGPGLLRRVTKLTRASVLQVGAFRGGSR